VETFGSFLKRKENFFSKVFIKKLETLSVSVPKKTQLLQLTFGTVNSSTREQLELKLE
jgi:hypothetical protein